MTTRRLFLTSAVTFSVGSASAIVGAQRLTAPTSAKASPADALESYLTFVNDLRTELLFLNLRLVRDTSIRCNKLLKDISELVSELDNEVAKTQSRGLKNHVKDLRRMTERKVTVSSLGDSIDSADSLPFKYFSAEMEVKLQAVIPEAKTVLSEKASRILNRLFEKVRATAPVRALLEQQEAEAEKRNESIRTDIASIESSIYKTITLVDRAEKQDPPEDTITRLQAAETLSKALSVIEKLGAPPATSPAVEVVHALTTLLQGVIYWIKNPSEVESAAVSSRGKEVQFIKTRGELHSLGFLQTLESVLASFCKRDSLVQLAVLITCLLMPLTAWMLGREALGRPVTQPEKVAEIERTLRSWATRVQRACGQNPDFTAMAKALDPFV